MLRQVQDEVLADARGGPCGGWMSAGLGEWIRLWDTSPVTRAHLPR